MTTQIPPELVAAYRSAEYWIGDGADAFCMTIDQHSMALEKLYRDRGVSGAAYITAFNPYSRKTSPAGNEAAHQALLTNLQQRGVPTLHAVSKDREGRHQEKGLLALGLHPEAAQALGNLFEQNAIVVAGADATPQLVLLR
jgi:hypothetical protein